MGKFFGLTVLLALALWLTGCATGEPRLQGTWKSNKVPMGTEMVKVTKMQTVKVGKGRKKKTKQVPTTVTVARPKSAPPYIDLIVRYEGAHMTLLVPGEGAERPKRAKFTYEVVESDEKSVTIDILEPTTQTKRRIQIFFEGPNRYYVNPVGGEGWKEYYVRIPKG